MATDWAADVKKFVPNADDEVINGIISYCGIALQSRDSSLVAFKDPEEIAKVKSSFLRKKLGLTDSEDVLDNAIAAVGTRMKGVNFKKRPTVYYLLLEELGSLHLFKKAGAAAVAGGAAIAGGAAAAGGAKSSTGAAPAVAAAVAAPLAAASIPAAKPVAPPAVAAKAVSTATPSAAYKSPRVGPSHHFAIDDGKFGSGWWILWLLAGLAFLWALMALFSQNRSAVATTTNSAITVPLTDDANMTAAVPDAPSIAPAATPVVIPVGAGVTSEEREAKPLVKVYFDTGKSQVVDAFTAEAAKLKAYLDTNPGSSLGVSGYNDPTGNAAANAELSKNRAQAVQAALVKAGIPAASIELIKPEAATDAQVTKEEARRVEVYIK